MWKWDPDRSREGREKDTASSSYSEGKGSSAKLAYDSKVGADAIDMDSDSDDGMDIS